LVPVHVPTHSTNNGSLIKVLEFIGEREIHENIANQSVDYCSFEHLRKLETHKRFKKSVFKVRDAEDPDFYKNRKGKAGGCTDFLSEEDQAFVDKLIKKRNFDFERFV